MEPGNNEQFRAIGRIRPGHQTVFSPYTVAALISIQLQTYDGISTINMSLPNFIVRFSNEQSYLEFLTHKELHGPDFVLDIMPSIPEYETFDIPWMINREISVRTSDVPKKYMQELAGQPPAIRRYISGLILQGGLGIARPDAASQTEKIYIHGLCVPRASLKNRSTRFIDEIEDRSIPDFSSLMIAELHDFYQHKFKAFRHCKEMCKDIYEIAQLLDMELDPKLQPIYDHIKRFSKRPPQQVESYIAQLNGSLASLQLYIAEELFGLKETTCPIYNTSIMPMNLTQYVGPHGQVHTPSASGSLLRDILSAVVYHVYDGPPNIETYITADKAFCTAISGPQFRHRYISTNATSVMEAEASAIYRFLKHMTNVKGYTIVDRHYPSLFRMSLFRMICMIANYGTELDGLRVCATKAIKTIDDVREHIEDMQKNVINKWYHGSSRNLTARLRACLRLATKYRTAVHAALRTFDYYKEMFNSAKFTSDYCPRPDQ